MLFCIKKYTKIFFSFAFYHFYLFFARFIFKKKYAIFPVFSTLLFANFKKNIEFTGVFYYYVYITNTLKKGKFMEYITTKEASEKWGISTIRITVLANEGRIPGAQRLGRSWIIPATATKPKELKPNHYSSAEKETEDDFSFPLFHFRPDWTYLNKNNLTEQEQQLLSAETAVFECRFSEAYPILEKIMHAPENVATETGCLWNAGICCIALNKPDVFSKIVFRLQMIMADEFPHRNDLKIIFDSLKTYTESLSVAANEYKYDADIHNQCLPTASLLEGYSQLTEEAINPKSTDVNLLELNLRFIENTGAVIATEFLHLFMLGIYYLRDDKSNAEKHAEIAVKLAFENKYYFPLATYYRYFVPILAPIIEKYPKDFQNHCSKLFSKYDENFNAFLSSMGQYSPMEKLKDTDFPYIYAIMMNLSNAEIAKRMNVSVTTINRRLDAICLKLNVSGKKELKYLLKNSL